MENDVYNNPDVTYDSYLQPEIEFPIPNPFGGVAITSINGITGPTVTFAGGTSGFSFAPGGTTITLVSPLTAKGDLYTHDATNGIALAVGTNGFVLSANSGTATGLEWIANATGTVTSVSVVSANGFAGTVATATTTPAITLSTTITGVLKGDGTAISAAASADIITALGYTPTNAAIVPNTAPSAGQILVGNAGSTAYAKQTVSGSGATISLASTGVMTISGIANASLTNSAITINGTSVSLGGTRTLTLASSDFANQGTTTTVLHGNAAGNPSFGAVSLTADITGTLAAGNGGTGITSLGTGVATALGTNIGTAGSFITNGGALGTPSGGTVTNLTGTASININGTVGATTPTTGSFSGVTVQDATNGILILGSVGSGSYSQLYQDVVTTDGLFINNHRSGSGSDINFQTASTTKMKIFNNGGVTIGAPTGGNQGAGTLNLAADVYKNGSAYTNPHFGFEHAYTGKVIRYADRMAAMGIDDYQPLSFEQFEEYTRHHFHFPYMGDDAENGIFSGGERLLLITEELAVHLFELNARVRKLEAGQ